VTTKPQAAYSGSPGGVRVPLTRMVRSVSHAIAGGVAMS